MSANTSNFNSSFKLNELSLFLEESFREYVKILIFQIDWFVESFFAKRDGGNVIKNFEKFELITDISTSLMRKYQTPALLD